MPPLEVKKLFHGEAVAEKNVGEIDGEDLEGRICLLTR